VAIGQPVKAGNANENTKAFADWQVVGKSH
jgi:hypothetical protein